jgi:hypothetical protein
MDLSTFKWLNESRLTIDGDSFTIYALAKTDFYNNPVPYEGEPAEPLVNAPFLYTEVEGDFVARVRVTPNFVFEYDAACIMVIQDAHVWLKAAYEQSNIGTALVSVVTNGVSDDANGCTIDAESVWLQVARAGNNFAFHYSPDGVKFDMVRLCTLPVGGTVKVGVQAQCPHGDGGERGFYGLTVEKRTVKDLRTGV